MYIYIYIPMYTYNDHRHQSRLTSGFFYRKTQCGKEAYQQLVKAYTVCKITSLGPD